MKKGLQYWICKKIKFELLQQQGYYVVLTPELVIDVYDDKTPSSLLRMLIMERLLDLSKWYKECLHEIRELAVGVLRALYVRLHRLDPPYPQPSPPTLAKTTNKQIECMIEVILGVSPLPKKLLLSFSGPKTSSLAPASQYLHTSHDYT